MIENLKTASPINQGLFVMIAGLSVVFITLVVFFFLIKLLAKLYPEENGQPLLKRIFGLGKKTS